MAIVYMDGFEEYQRPPKPKLGINYSERVCKIADSLKMNFTVQHGYMEFENEEDYAIIQLYV